MGGEVGFFMFPMSSHQVPQVLIVFLNMFPIAPHFIPYALHKVVLLSPLYITLRSVLLLNTLQNSKMKFCENMKLTC
jgi:hypothetical protein